VHLPTLVSPHTGLVWLPCSRPVPATTLADVVSIEGLTSLPSSRTPNMVLSCTRTYTGSVAHAVSTFAVGAGLAFIPAFFWSVWRVAARLGELPALLCNVMTVLCWTCCIQPVPRAWRLSRYWTSPQISTYNYTLLDCLDLPRRCPQLVGPSAAADGQLTGRSCSTFSGPSGRCSHCTITLEAHQRCGRAQVERAATGCAT